MRILDYPKRIITMDCPLDTNAIIIILIMIAAGILGGYTNYLMIKQDPSKDDGDPDNVEIINNNLWKKSLFLGVSASLLVPLFLTTISSNILELDSPETYPLKNYFIVGGFCLIAAIFSKRFIEDVYSRIIKVEKEAKEAKAKAEDVKEVVDDLQENSTEVNAEDVDSMLAILSSTKKIQNKPFIEEVKKVIGAFNNSTFTYRTVTGLSKDADLPDSKVGHILEWLRELKISSSKPNKKGNIVWKIHKDRLYGNSGSKT